MLSTPVDTSRGELADQHIPRHLLSHTILYPPKWMELQNLVFRNVSNTSRAVQVLNGRYQCEAATCEA
jgi:hypothetical protein